MLRSVKAVAGGQWPVARTAVVLLLFAGLSFGALLPDQVGAYKKEEPKTIGVPDQALYSEYGINATEQAEYASADKHFSATAWRFQDSTGAMAMFEARRPAGAVPSSLTKLAVKTSDGVIFAYGNYVFQLTGSLPADLSPVYANLPGLDQSPLPILMSLLPKQNLAPNSERYVVGPVSLDRFVPGVAPSIAAFHLEAEAQTGNYKTPKGLMKLAIFDYPTPSIARDRDQAFQKIPGAVVRRVGPLVAVTISPPDADVAERVLDQVKYEVNVTLNEKVPVDEAMNTVKFLLDVFAFAGMLIVLCLAGGLLFAGARLLSRKLNKGEDPGAMITLHLK